MKYFESRQIETFVPMLNNKPLLGSLVFLHCTEQAILRTKSDWFTQIAVYRDAKKEKPEPIPTEEMENFKMVLSIKNQDFIPLEIRDQQFLAGQKVRVLAGPFKGAEGVIKRVKGDRRLIVAVSGIAAVATSFIPPAWLKPLTPE